MVAFLNRAGVGEELGVGRVGARVAALDVVDAEIVEHGGDAPLLLYGKVDARRLRAVTQRRVKQIQPLFTHLDHIYPKLRAATQKANRTMAIFTAK